MRLQPMLAAECCSQATISLPFLSLALRCYASSCLLLGSLLFLTMPRIWKWAESFQGKCSTSPYSIGRTPPGRSAYRLIEAIASRRFGPEKKPVHSAANTASSFPRIVDDCCVACPEPDSFANTAPNIAGGFGVVTTSNTNAHFG